MKHILCLAILVLNVFLFSMEIELSTMIKNQADSIQQADPIEKIGKAVNTINMAINRKNNLSFLNFLTLTREDHLGAIQAINECYPTITITNRLIECLKTKNKSFSAALDYFTELALNNYENVTPTTIAYVENPETQQPIAELNNLALPIKKYVMQCARINIDHFCTITLKTESPIRYIDMAKNIPQAVTCHDNNEINIWDLTTGRKCVSIKEPGINSPALNSNGTQLALLCFDNDIQKKQIKIFKLISIQSTLQMQPQQTIELPNKEISSISYLHDNNNLSYFTLCGFTKIGMHTWLIKEKERIYLGACSWNNPRFTSSTDNYTTKIPRGSIPKIEIKKEAKDLYLCLQALKSACNQNDISKIRLSESYNKLTLYERDLLGKYITEKMQSLKQPLIPVDPALLVTFINWK